MNIIYNNDFILFPTERVYLIAEKFPQLYLSSVGHDALDITEYKKKNGS